MVFLTSPNNPDGSVIAEEDLLAILKLPVLVVLDEAYIEFSEDPSRLRWVVDHPNLVIFRTFSKSAGLAGLRVGYGGPLLVQTCPSPGCLITGGAEHRAHIAISGWGSQLGFPSCRAGCAESLHPSWYFFAIAELLHLPC